MDFCNSRGVTSALLASWLGIGYLIKDSMGIWSGGRCDKGGQWWSVVDERGESDDQRLTKLYHLQCYLNLAACYLKLKEYRSCINCCSELPARGFTGVNMGCIPPSFVLNYRPALNSGPGIFPDFDLGHDPDCNPGPHSVSNSKI
ncbi:hypothetical protein EVAR_31740_1 [Eumeta japonica]|uniref:Uncharacterized protein n=1 Tax=Eumeta variegata TaxID=151549 RepID=A0A4C1YMD5_EUMVA|nr:hypothetical protein EVAR_31740_1 [Eumeta japonica]